MGLRIVYALAAGILVAVFQFVVCLTGHPAFIILAGAVLGILSYGLWKLVELEPRPRADWLMPGSAAVLGVVLGVALSRWLDRGSGGSDWFAAVLAAMVSAGIIGRRVWLAKRKLCDICHQALAEVACPRCPSVVCLRSSCWESRYFRCLICYEHGVTLFPLSDETWWRFRLGRRVERGECFKCLRPAAECDLRECGKCHWPLCTRCWDFENGRCVRCRWIMPDLPSSLHLLLKRSRQ